MKKINLKGNKIVKSKKVIIGTLIGTTVICGGMICKNNKDNQNALSIVQNGTSKINKECTYKQAYEKYLDKCCWATYVNSDGQRIVNVNGDHYNQEHKQVMHYSINYLVHEEKNTFEFIDGKVNDYPLNAIDVLKITIQMMATYNSESNY